jgi:predicted permease
MREWLRKVSFFRKKGFDSELEQEMQFHLESRADELEQSGLTRRDALTQARREFGRTSRISEQSREAWQFRWIEDLAADLRHASRAFRRDPAFVLAAVFSLALGIGVNTTIFSLTVESLFSEPSVREAETLVTMRLGGNSHSPLREYQFVRDANVFPGLAGSREFDEVNWRYGDNSYRIFASRVTDNYFEVMGIPIALGRPMRTGEIDVAILSHRFWQARLGGMDEILGRVLVLDGRPHTIVGVLPLNHRTPVGFGYSPDLYMPASGKRISVALYARLPKDMNHHEAAARLQSVALELDRAYPNEAMKWAEHIQVSGVTGTDRLNRRSTRSIAAFFAMLMIVVALLLAIACANVASLLLARTSSRAHELAIRLCIGAGRGRIVRQLLAESLLLAIFGTAAGLALNIWLTGLLNRIELPIPAPIRLSIQPDWRLLLYAGAVAIVSALMAGLIPALKATRSNANSELKRGGHQVVSRRFTMRNALVIGQLALSIIVLTTAFLFVRNLIQSTAMDLGFDADRVVWAYMRLVPERYAAPEKKLALAADALDQIRALPGIESASVAQIVPLNDGQTSGGAVQTQHAKDAIHVQYHLNRVWPGYFQTMGIPILTGREFSATDRKGAPRVVVLNDTFARRVFGAMNPAGQTIHLHGDTLMVIGVARDSKYLTLGESGEAALYESYLQGPQNANLHVLIRTGTDPETLRRGINSKLTALDESASVEVKTMNRALGLALLPSRAGAGLLGAIGMLGLILASLGLYGVLVYSVSRRTREIGVRVAIGARPADIFRMVFAESAWLVGLGIAIGVFIALFVTKPLAMFLVPGLTPADPFTYAIVIAVLALAGILASLLPTVRALRVDPMIALRYE